MRNLKRALSLTLASVMLLGMMVIGTSAASFTDADQITNETAATVLQELEVMQGSNGKFNPNSTVTRGQMAILICKMLYGDKLNAENFAGTSEFTDVPASAYYTGYVNLATQLGIISGYGNGKFGPGAPVTTAQAALMLTRALGWFQAGELENQSWTSNAIAAVEKATSVNLFGSMKLANDAPLSRDNVAEMVFNALTKTAPVKYNERWDAYYTNEGEVLGGVKFNYLNSLGYKNFTLVYNTSEDDFGRPATEWGIGTATRGDVETDDHGNIKSATIKTSFIKAADEATLTYTDAVKGKTIFADLGKPSGITVKSADGTAGYYERNGAKTSMGAVTLNNSCDEKLGVKGDLIEVYRKDNDVRIVLVKTYVAKVDGNYNEGKGELVVKEADSGITLPSGVKYKLSKEDLDGLDAFSDGDYVLLTIIGSEVKTIEKADVISGKLTSYRSDKLTVDGKTYSTTDSYKGKYTGDTDVDADLVMDKNGYVIFAKAAKADDQYVYVTEYAKKSGLGDTKYDATFYFVDSTKESAVVEKVTGKDWSGAGTTSTDTHAGWYTYEKNSNGSYDLKAVDSAKLKEGTVDKTTATGAVNGLDDDVVTDTNNANVRYDADTTVRANNETVFIVLRDKTVTVYNGIREVPKIAANHASDDVTVKAIMDKGVAEYIFITAASANMTITGGGVADHIYILDAVPTRTKDGDDTVYSYLVVQNGEIVSVNMTDVEDAGGDAWAVGLYKDIETDSKGRIKDAAPVSGSGDSELKVYTIRGGVEIKGDVLEVNGNGLTMAKEFTIYKCDKEDTEEITEGDLNRDYKSGMNGEVAVVLDDGKVIEIYVLDDADRVGAVNSNTPLTPGTNIRDFEALRPGEIILGGQTAINGMDNVPNDVAPGQNIVIAFKTTAANQKVLLEIKEATDVKYEEWATYAEAGIHYFYVNLKGLNGRNDNTKLAANGKDGAWEATGPDTAGTPATGSATCNWSVDVVTNTPDGDGNPTAAFTKGTNLASGSFTIPSNVNTN